MRVYTLSTLYVTLENKYRKKKINMKTVNFRLPDDNDLSFIFVGTVGGTRLSMTQTTGENSERNLGFEEVFKAALISSFSKTVIPRMHQETVEYLNIIYIYIYIYIYIHMYVCVPSFLRLDNRHTKRLEIDEEDKEKLLET